MTTTVPRPGTVPRPAAVPSTHHRVRGARRRAGATRPVRPRPGWRGELVLVAVLYLVYDASRLLPSSNAPVAERNGRRILHLEQVLHLDPERATNHALHAVAVLPVLASYMYETLHFIVTPVVLIWMYRAHAGGYRRARTWLAVATLGALVSFWLFPAAPPRMLSGLGIHDIVAESHRWGWWSGNGTAPHGLGGLVNDYAAMPSLHVGWALWCGWHIMRYARRRLVRVAGAAYPLVVAAVVVSTGNHYLADVLAGVALMAITGWAVSRLVPAGPVPAAPENTERGERHDAVRT